MWTLPPDFTWRLNTANRQHQLLLPNQHANDTLASATQALCKFYPQPLWVHKPLPFSSQVRKEYNCGANKYYPLRQASSVAEVWLGPVMVCELAELAGKSEPVVPDWSVQQLNPNMEVQCFTNSFPPLNSLLIEKNSVYIVYECDRYVWYVYTTGCEETNSKPEL